METAIRKEAGREAISFFAFVFRAELLRGAQTEHGVCHNGRGDTGTGGRGLCIPQRRMTQQQRLRAPAQRCTHGIPVLPQPQRPPRCPGSPPRPIGTPHPAVPQQRSQPHRALSRSQKPHQGDSEGPLPHQPGRAGPPALHSPTGRTVPSRGGAERHPLADTGSTTHPEGRAGKHIRAAGPVAVSEVRARIGSVRVGPYLPAPR